jgi:hypothetical protein
VTAVTTLTGGFEQQSKQAFKQVSEAHTDAVAEVGQEVRTSLGLVRFFPWLLVVFSVVLLASSAAWCWMAWDFGKLKDDAHWAAVYSYRVFEENGGTAGWEAWVKKHPEQ